MKDKTKNNEFQKRVVARMTHLGIDRKKLQLLTGLSRSEVYSITTGKIFDPRVSTIIALAEALNVDPVYFVVFKK